MTRDERADPHGAPADEPPARTVAALEDRWFDRCFVGRDAELSALDALLEGARERPAVGWLHGLAGVGKTALLRAWARSLRARAVPAAYVALDALPEATAALDAALREALDELGLGAPGLAGLGAERPGVLVLDGARGDEAGLLRWFFDARWPRLGARACVLVGARRGPSASRAGALARVASLRALALEDLTEGEVARFFERRGAALDGASLARVLGVCGGLPLALELVAAATREGAAALEPEALGAVTEGAADALLEGVATEGREALLELLALLREADAGLLDAALGAGAALAARRWLAGQRVARFDGPALRLHPLLRATLARALRRDDAERFEARLREALEALLSRLRLAPLDEQLALLLDALHAGRGDAARDAVLPLPAGRAPVLRRLAPDDEAAALLVARHEGEGAAALLRATRDDGTLWAHGLYDEAGALVGLLGSLALSDERVAARRDEDPLLAAALDAYPEGEREGVQLLRWAFSADEYQRVGPGATAVLLGTLLAQVEQFPQSHTVVVPLEAPPAHASVLASLELTRVLGAEATLGARRYELFTSPVALDAAGRSDRVFVAAPKLRKLLGLEGAGVAARGRSDAGSSSTSTADVVVAHPTASAPGEASARAAAAHAPGALDADELAAAVRDALQGLGRVDVLARSPLVALVPSASERTREETAAQVRALLQQGVDALARSDDYRSAAELLRLTYFDPGMKHEAAAIELGLPYGTYRYRHRRALSLLAQALAER